MSDTRFVILGTILVFAGFLLLGIFGRSVGFMVFEEESGKCYNFDQTNSDMLVDCNSMFQNKLFLFSLVLILIVSGILSLVKGIRGRWDQNVKNDEMVGPKND